MKDTLNLNIYTLRAAALAVALAISVTNVMAVEGQVPATATFNDTSWQTPLAAEFSKLDTSGNGLVMLNEAMRGKAFNAKTFAKADLDHDGSIDLNEYVYFKTGVWPVVAQPDLAVGKLVEKPLTTGTEYHITDAAGTPELHETAETESNMQMTKEISADAGTTKTNVGSVIDDSVITTKAKAKILATEHLKTLQISVETHLGEVILSGFVDSPMAKAKAEEVVLSIEGVKSVKNSLEVRS